MNDRIHRALDGELRTATLPRTESEELDRSRALFDSIVASVPSQPLPPLGASVLNRIDAIEGRTASISKPNESRGLASWLVSPQRISIRPAYVLALAASLAVVIGVTASRDNNRVAVAPASRSEVLVQFRLEAPRATTVSLAGDFNNWAPTHEMKRTEPGVWTIVVPLTPGVHDYSFIVDGNTWVPDPAAPARSDGFGGMNSRIAVIASDARRSL